MELDGLNRAREARAHRCVPEHADGRVRPPAAHRVELGGLPRLLVEGQRGGMREDHNDTGQETPPQDAARLSGHATRVHSLACVEAVHEEHDVRRPPAHGCPHAPQGPGVPARVPGGPREAGRLEEVHLHAAHLPVQPFQGGGAPAPAPGGPHVAGGRGQPVPHHLVDERRLPRRLHAEHQDVAGEAQGHALLLGRLGAGARSRLPRGRRPHPGRGPQLRLRAPQPEERLP